MSKPRMTVAEFAAAVGMSQMNAINTLRIDSRLPKHERQFPFITAEPPAERGGKWRYNIPRVQVEQWQAGQQVQVINYDVLAEAFLSKLIDLAAAVAQQMSSSA